MKANDILGRQQAMHETHTTWRSEHAAWEDDVERWSDQVREALDDLERIATLLRQFDGALRSHSRMIRKHDGSIARHERELADLQRKGLGEQYDPQTPTHEASGQVQRLERETHDALREKHRELFAQLRKLEAVAQKGPRERS